MAQVYVSCDDSLPGPLFVHPHSTVHSKVATHMPQYLVYGEVVRTLTRAYMKRVTTVTASWLPSLSQGQPAVDSTIAARATDPCNNTHTHTHTRHSNVHLL